MNETRSKKIFLGLASLALIRGNTTMQYFYRNNPIRILNSFSNTYRKMLETNYGKKVTGLYLVCMHPDNPYKNYERIEVPMLDAEMEALFEYRKQEVHR